MAIAKRAHTCHALVVNKGSYGREEKMVYFTSTIERELAKYIRDERACHDPQGRKRLCDLDDTDPIFLTTDDLATTRVSALGARIAVWAWTPLSRRRVYKYIVSPLVLS